MKKTRSERTRKGYTIFAIIISLMITFTVVPPTFATNGATGVSGPAAATDTTSADETAKNVEQDVDVETPDGDKTDQENGEVTQPADTDSDTPSDTENPESARSGEDAAIPEDIARLDDEIVFKTFDAADQDDKPEQRGTPQPLDKMISAVDVQRMGSTQTSWSDVDDNNPVKTGDDVKFTITYNVPMGFFKDNNTNTLTYKVTRL